MKKCLKIMMPVAIAFFALALLPSVKTKAAMAVDGYVEEINATFTAPTVGDPIQIQNPGFVTVSEGSHYSTVWNYLISALPSEAPNGYEINPDDVPADAVYEEGVNYYYEAWFVPEQTENEETGESAYYLFSNDGDVPITIAGVAQYERGNYDSDNMVSVYFKFTPKAAAEEQKEDTPAEDEKKEDTPAEEEKKEETPAKEEEAKPVELKILDGADQEVDGTGDVTIRANGEFANFDKLLMDDKEVDPSNYDKKEGSTIVTLKAAYVASLGAGAHTVSFVYKDGSAVKTTLTLKATGNSEATPAAENTSTPAATPAPAAAATDSVAPKTGENIMWIYVILAMSALGMGVTAVSIKKNK